MYVHKKNSQFQRKRKPFQKKTRNHELIQRINPKFFFPQKTTKRLFLETLFILKIRIV